MTETTNHRPFLRQRAGSLAVRWRIARSETSGTLLRLRTGFGFTRRGDSETVGATTGRSFELSSGLRPGALEGGKDMDAQVTLVGAKAHSGDVDKEVVVTTIGGKGHIFSGTFTGRSALGGIDFVLGVYTEKEAGLHMTMIASDTDRPLGVERIDHTSWAIKFDENVVLGTFKYDAGSGNFSITSKKYWFQGELMGTYMHVI